MLVFDDTDRWLTGSAYPEPDQLVSAFFGRVLPALAELRCSLVVAVHGHYLHGESAQRDIDRILDTRVDVPPLVAPAAIAEVLASRVRVHSEPDAPPDLSEVVTTDGIDRLFSHYREGLRGELRGVLRIAHVALADACDSGADSINGRLIDAALAASGTFPMKASAASPVSAGSRRCRRPIERKKRPVSGACSSTSILASSLPTSASHRWHQDLVGQPASLSRDTSRWPSGGERTAGVDIAAGERHDDAVDAARARERLEIGVQLLD